jgi:alanyl-tRNA synthetase
MTSNEIRSSFLEFFENRGHRIVPGSPLVPADDPTLLFTNAGMNQFKDTLLGREKRDYTRAATAQKIMRVSGKHNDLDNVGPSHRHHTFFEMLGNFSFGDYFKKEALPFSWELLTEVWKLDPNRMVVSIFKGENGIPRDSEAYDIWRSLGVPPDRILELGGDDNFWQMGDTGPCGRCSEIYYVRGGSGYDPEIELWNNVFMEFERSADGKLTPLPAPSIDTGMGLERVTAVLQEKQSNYDTDVFQPLLGRIGELTGHRYGDDERSDISMRVVADHIRSTTFLIGDGVIPSNEWRGYVLRKIMRRAMRHGKHLGLTEPFMHKLVAVLDRDMGDAYPGVRTNREMIEKTILAEEHRFEAVLTEGLPRLEAEIAKVLGTKSRVLGGDAAFKLYDTFGVPFDFIEDTAATQGVTVDKDGFEHAMEGQRDKARAKSGFKGGDEPAWFVEDRAEINALNDAFRGYDTTTMIGVPIAILYDEQPALTEVLREGQTGWVILPETPFYLEAGGQVSDAGRIHGPRGEALVDAMRRIPVRKDFPRAHHVRIVRGELRTRDIVTAEVDVDARDATRRNHTATHLLHAALRQVLGSHVKQAGSLVAPDRLRFDFVHFQAITREDIDRIERIVNEQVYRNVAVTTDVDVSPEKAVAAGAMALFGEKYGDKVRVVSVPGFSVELCGGTHVRATGDIGFFAILAESGVAAGVRRIEAVTGAGAVEWAQQQRSALNAVVGALKVNPNQAVETIDRLQADTKRLTRELTQLKMKVATGDSRGAAGDASAGGSQDGDTVDVAGVRLARRKLSDLDKDALRGVADSLKAQIKSGIVILASTSDGKVQIVVAVTPDLTARIKAGQIVKELAPIVGGAGGGRPDFAEAGGKQPEKIDEMLAASEAVVAKLLG